MKNLFIALLFSIALIGGASAQTTSSAGLNPFIAAGHYQYQASAWQSIQYSWSATNRDSAFFADSGRVATVQTDSLGDSLFFQYNVTPGIGSTINVGFLPDRQGDTLCDSVFVYQNTYKQLGKCKIYAAPSYGQNTFAIYVGSSALVPNPQLITIKSKWKKIAGKGKHYLRCKFNFLPGN